MCESEREIACECGLTKAIPFPKCFVTGLRWGLTSGGGLGENMHQESSFNSFMGRAVFDLAFFIIVLVIGLNVVFGIIVDTFSELRDERFEIEEHMESKCFICG